MTSNTGWRPNPPRKPPLSTPFGKYAQRLRDNGYSPMPVAPGTKVPGKHEFKRWKFMGDWTRRCTEPANDLVMSFWDQYPDAGVCVACGYNGLVAIDVDLEVEDIVAAIDSVLPESHVTKRGAKGSTRFYRAEEPIASRPFDVEAGRALDLLAHGRQTVIPPTIHPAGMPYEWLTPETLLTVPADDLPVLPDDIASQLEEALAPFGYVEPPAPRAVGAGAAESIWSALNGAALERLQDWVPMLGLPSTRRHGRGFRAVPVWRPSSTGRHTADRNPNLSFDPRGIKDMGADRGYTALDVVIAARGTSFSEAANWLADQIGFRLAKPDDEFDIDAFIRNSVNKKEGVR